MDYTHFPIRLTVLVALTAGLSLSSGCKKEGPCSGGGMTVDERALPTPWKELAPAPAGAIACADEQMDMRSEWARSYELGDSPKAGYEAFYDQLKSKGWMRVPYKSDERYETMFEQAGHRLKLFTSSNVKDKGWVTLTFTQAKPK
ncbi:MAG: hypothetical protein ACI9OJ_005918 [Myxococcota bacterium]|jgi:hypothetical protein